ncbi:MAG TPA: hypothetical protein VFA27_17805 [Vicinamibacterales bacterium]|nr:hypothetical protein [Vicinamibacterales bacterium]
MTLAVAAFAVGCSSDNSSTPTTPTTPTLNLTGTWATTITYSGISARMTWVLAQSANAVTGPVTIALPTGTVLVNGFLNGTLSGTSMPYTITVAAGGIPLQPTCAGQLQGTLTASATTLVGPMNLTSSTCTSPITTQNLTMTKQ